jgi:hypothetical protein
VVAPEDQHLEVRARGGQLAQKGGGAVAAAVVDRDDLEALAGRSQRSLDLVEQRSDVFALVTDGQNDAEVQGRRRLSPVHPNFYLALDIGPFGVAHGIAQLGQQTAEIGDVVRV